MRRGRAASARRALAAFALCAAVSAGVGSAAAATTSHASLTDIENDVMCVSCRESLAVAQSPQSYAERNFIRTLIAQGDSKAQIERALVGQYGPAVLGRPPARGFNLTVYIIPPAILVLGLVTLAIALPRWRARTRANPVPLAAGPSLSSAETRRLDEDLARYDG